MMGKGVETKKKKLCLHPRHIPFSKPLCTYLPATEKKDSFIALLFVNALTGKDGKGWEEKQRGREQRRKK